MMPVRPAERPHETVARLLRAAILDGTYGSGDRLPVERELSERFEVSRTTVRQALLILDQQGLVRVRPGVGGGPFVTRETLPAVITAFENLVATDDSSADEFVSAKMVIEPAVAAMAARVVSPLDIQRLEDNVARTRAAANRGDDIKELSLEFHRILFHATRNRYLEVVLEILNRTFDRLPGLTLSSVNEACVLNDHAELLDALRRRNAPQVRDLMESHLAGVWAGQADGYGEKPLS